ncbi:MAG: hypothetical protein AAF726_11725 [Planctomycetota bacterium]
MLRAGPLSEHSRLLDETFVNAWILIQDAKALAADEDGAPKARSIAASLADAYLGPISSHVVDPDGALRSTYRGNSFLEGASYEAFLRKAGE